MKKLCLIFAMSAKVAFGDAISVEELKSIQSKFKNYDHLTVEFKQTKFVSTRPTRPVKLKGNASFSKPTKFKWVVHTKGGDDVLIFDGQSMIQYKNETGNRYKSNGDQMQELTRIVDLVLNFDALLQSYRPIRQERNGDLVEIEMEPKVPVGDLEKLEVKYDTKMELLSYLKMTFKNKNSSIYEFSNPEMKPINSATYAPPAGVKIFDAG